MAELNTTKIIAIRIKIEEFDILILDDDDEGYFVHLILQLLKLFPLRF